MIAVPRLKRYGEMIDDHQLEITGELERAEKIIAVYDVDELECALRNVGENLVHVGSERAGLANALRRHLMDLDSKIDEKLSNYFNSAKANILLDVEEGLDKSQTFSNLGIINPEDSFAKSRLHKI